MTRVEFLKQLMELLDSAPFNWTLFEDDLGSPVFVTDLMDSISFYNQGRDS